MENILVIDEGTTSTRAILFGADGREIAVAQRELTQYYPAPGLVEHDAAEIWERSLACAQEMVAAAGGADQIAAIGITNQRETIVFWDAASGEPLSRAIVWQDRRTADRCAELREAGHEDAVQAKDRAAARSLFQRDQDRLGARALARLARGGRAAALRHGRILPRLSPDRRPPRQRRDQRVAHRADGHP